jgi:hypothetical protein
MCCVHNQGVCCSTIAFSAVSRIDTDLLCIAVSVLAADDLAIVYAATVPSNALLILIAPVAANAAVPVIAVCENTGVIALNLPFRTQESVLTHRFL